MDTITVISIIIALSFGAALLILVVGGLLLRSDVHRRATANGGIEYSRARIVADLRAVQDLLVDFIAESAPAAGILTLLRKQNEPVRIGKLLQARNPEAEHERDPSSQFSFEEAFAALFVMGIAGLVRFGRSGAALTSAGREVLRRLNETSAVETIERRSANKREMAETINSAPLPKAAPPDDHSSGARALPGFRIGQLRTSTLVPSQSFDFASERNGSVSPERKQTARAIVTAADHDELSAAIAAARKLAAPVGQTRSLLDKLTHAKVVSADDLPPDVITMNTRARLVDVETNERLDLILVYPIDANFAEGRISVFHPLGAAILGRRVGEEIEWPVPYGVRRFEVRAIDFQPEAALALAA